MTEKTLQYTPFNSCVNSSFWHKLAELKLDIDMLDEKIRSIWGNYTCTNPPGICSMQLDSNSFVEDYFLQKNSLCSYGVAINKNTIESFKETNKGALLEEHCKNLGKDILEGHSLYNPSLLSRFVLLTYVDLKKYMFYFWFAFPAVSTSDVELIQNPSCLGSIFNEQQCANLALAFEAISDWKQRSYFIVEVNGDMVKIHPLSLIHSVFSSPVSEHGDARFTSSKVYISFADPCISSQNPGWPLRNLLCLLSCQCKYLIGVTLKVICFRLKLTSNGVWSCSDSLLLEIKIQSNHILSSDNVKWIGWQRNEKGNFGPRMVNLRASMDPMKLSETAVDLNLKLMKWRLLPDINLVNIKDTKCLLLGAGTLGCNVARILLGWGIKTINFVDNGKVSYSNPVRQSLYTYSDCKNGGRHKAEAASASLLMIHPGVSSQGYNLSIPMPGHVVGESLLEETKSQVKILEDLIDAHDVVFLLMDSRESRWLPTLIGASKQKLVMNAALGFDTFVVMRHGMKPSDPSNQSPQLGCYFCNDVTAPGNSQADRTLDQQCTVTRPGISAIAASLVVELMISVLEHPLKGYCYADTSGTEHVTNSANSPLGLVPHSIRGFLSQFEQLMPVTHSFSRCIACSDKVIEEYKDKGFNFLLSVFNKPKYLEELTGLTDLQKDCENLEIWDLSDNEENCAD